jgi:protein-S-isoprenylcysteine O-methyltransferase Ste14
MSDDGFIQRGGLWVAAQSVLTLAALLLAPLLRSQWHNSIATVFGVLLLGVGAWFGIAGVRALGHNRTPFPQPLEASTLVRRGVYGVVRHPLYSSLICATAGWALVWGSWAGLAAAGALTLILRGKAIREEHWLRDRYPEYVEYARRVKAFVPGVW